jgi:hypothetical protein
MPRSSALVPERRWLRMALVTIGSFVRAIG